MVVSTCCQYFFFLSFPSCAFITFEKMESADQAVAEVGVIYFDFISGLIYILWWLISNDTFISLGPWKH